MNLTRWLCAVVAVLPSSVAAQGRRVAADPALAVITFAADSTAATLIVGAHRLAIRVERGSRVPTTGRYSVLLDNQVFAVAASRELILGAPSVAFISSGDPTVVMLSTYTGGNAVPGYYLKLLVLGGSARQAYTLDSETVGQIATDLVEAFERRVNRTFELRLVGGLRIQYEDKRLDVIQQP